MATGRMNEVIHHLRRLSLVREMAGLTDGQLLEDYISRRNAVALATLVRRHGPMVWGVCLRVLHNYHDAEDAFQAAFLVFVRKAESINSRELLANWLYGVARKTALKARATAARRKGRERPAAEMPEPAAAEQDLWRDLLPFLDEELSRLPAKYRIVIVLCGLEGKTRKETARQLGVPEGTVATRLARARTMLAKRLSQRGVVLTGVALAASVPASVLSSTIKAASLIAAGQAVTAGAISVKVAVLTEGVLKTMFLMKLKTVVGVLLAVCVIAVTATGITYRAMAGEKEKPAQRQEVQSDQPLQVVPLKDQKDLKWADLIVEVERLHADNTELKKQLLQQVRKEKAGDAKLVIKFYQVKGLVDDDELQGNKGPISLIRVITKIIEPKSWDSQGGEGAIEYFPSTGSLIVRQTPEIQKQVQEFVDVLRETRTEQEKNSM
jgi:RNA polymerase sigma factor (sigma-70 family)